MSKKSNLVILRQAGSTQDEAYKIALDGAPEGVAVITTNQTYGRGRTGRSWISPPGKNLALSLILRPQCYTEKAPLYGLMASVAAASAVEHFTGRVAHLKWPNDVLIEGKKIAGVLSQARIRGSLIEFLIIGLGLNINCTESDFPNELRKTRTSMFELTSRTFDIIEVGETFISDLKELYIGCCLGEFRHVLDLWSEKWIHKGFVVERDGIRGIAEGIDDSGALEVRRNDGSLVKISSGEINFSE